MAEIAFEGFHGPRDKDEWGLDGWSSKDWKQEDVFKLLLTGEEDATIAFLTVEQCSQLAAALIEHAKEIHDASEENIS